MVIEAGTQLTIVHQRYGTFTAIAERDFDTADHWWPVRVKELVKSRTRDWQPGEAIPCRRAMASLEVAA